MREKFAGIQALRAIAIGLVLLYHLSITPLAFQWLIPSASIPFWSGVELFFVISGFVVTQSLLRPAGFSPIPFAIRRVFRLYPAILFFLAVSAVHLSMARSADLSAPLQSLFGLEWPPFRRQMLGVLTGTLINQKEAPTFDFGAMWSLSVEFQFYFGVFAICVAGVLIRGVQAKAVMLWLACLFYTFLLASRLYGYVGPIPAPIAHLLFFNFDFLLIGVLIAFGHHAGFRPKTSAAFYSAIAIAGALFMLAFFRTPLEAPRSENDLRGMPMILCGWLYGFAVWCASAHQKQGTLSRVLGEIGDRSYSLYLLHFPVMALVWLAIFTASPAIASDPVNYALLQVVLVGLACGVLVEFSYRIVERPTRRFGALLAARAFSRQSSARLTACP